MLNNMNNIKTRIKSVVYSRDLLCLLGEFLTTLSGDPYEIVIITCMNDKLQFDDFEKTIDVAAREDWKSSVEVKQLEALVRLLKTIPGQPLLITFKNSTGWIEIEKLIV